jgi:hypothetical protein
MTFFYLKNHVDVPSKRNKQKNGTPTKRQVSKRLKRQVYKTSGLQNIRFTKRQAFKIYSRKKHPYIFCTCGWWTSAGSVAAMFVGKVMVCFILYFRRFFPYITIISNNDTLFTLNRNANLAIPILFV